MPGPGRAKVERIHSGPTSWLDIWTASTSVVIRWPEFNKIRRAAFRVAGQISEAERSRLQSTHLGANCGTETCPHADTSTQHSKNRPLYGASTRVPTHRPAPRLAAQIRELSPSPPWHPTTARKEQNSGSWVAGRSTQSHETPADP